jgi:hypothetical protein
MLDTNGDVDRAFVRRVVEDHWRSVVLFWRDVGATQPIISRDEFARLTVERLRQFNERNETTAALMQPKQAATFQKMIEEEDTLCFEEHQRDPDALYRRLGLNLTSNPQPQGRVTYHRQGLGELAVRTAVRATVWELIWSLFRR